jgi:4a-hydroxytetrahydrobiopterin dehydratase
MHHSLSKSCDPCAKLARPIALKEAKILVGELKGWTLIGGKALRKEFVMKDFMAAVHFIDAIARAAEAEGHHPDLHLTGYRNLSVELSTHAIAGLSMNDFILAERLDAIRPGLRLPARRAHAAHA